MTDKPNDLFEAFASKFDEDDLINLAQLAMASLDTIKTMGVDDEYLSHLQTRLQEFLNTCFE